ncbi:DNA ligase [Shewanella sp. A25]|nr:DNA ligase [Shewanella shenzhenensis]
MTLFIQFCIWHKRDWLFAVVTVFVLLSAVYAAPLPAATKMAPQIQLATVFNAEDVDQIDDYLVSEKLDGVRGYWDGRRLFTRQGYSIAAPSWFTAEFPPVPLDGELWIGRGQFESISSLVRQFQSKDEDWRQVHFMVFDLPKAEGDFASRYQQALQLVNDDSTYIQVIEQLTLPSIDALYHKLNEVVEAGGEGVMLHKKSSLYQVGRTPHLMKLKRYLDAEAEVIGYVEGKGQFSGQMGALKVKTADGRIFSIGTGFSVAQRQHPPAIGSVVTYKYFGLTVNGLPRFASFLRIRSDLHSEAQEGEVPISP